MSPLKIAQLLLLIAPLHVDVSMGKSKLTVVSEIIRFYKFYEWICLSAKRVKHFIEAHGVYLALKSCKEPLLFYKYLITLGKI